MLAVFLYNKFNHKLRLCAMGMVLVCGVFSLVNRSVAQDVFEDQIKSVFLYNLAHFVTWPNSIVQGASTFNIGVYGSVSFQAVLQQTVETETKDGRELVVSRINDPDDITALCRILFVTKEAKGDWEKIKAKIADLPILTVSDGEDFINRGGMVSLLRQNKKIQIEVDYKRVQQAGLSMSAKLLRLARVVE
ncbi:MAG: hypothetical protein COA36_09995 [Desulfotalea sp.]|nr:MAG: hypothetical protein COA36_09995 [Desulfotalea sp.]